MVACIRSLLMGALLGIVLSTNLLSADDKGRDHDHHSERQREDDLDDRNLYQENQRDLQREGEPEPCHACPHGQKLSPQQMMDSGI